ncbi:PhnB protein [Pseudooceanicola antarcticus]|uniref:PhnB protein n=1 Tax=Pseudooceanicola antarcticus TaxID=1247613 RepID=A0A285IPE9_9RHOB|nr:glyoxalase/bleomycin resistance/extradiol dioxygenase family protein [Pseudooceanicola antarcticus]PJE31465.1 VOC family protein [Pseudooceanicola antarcticus]SNY49868.1 PhnB protein [Pseudooceanicola antarcticus]
MAIYLYFDGEARAALDYYARIFRTPIEQLLTLGEMPEPPEQVSLHRRIMHGRICVMGQDIMVADSWEPGVLPDISGFAIELEFEDLDQARLIHLTLSGEGEDTSGFGPTFWARGFGTCRDKFGVPWMINCD